MTPEVPYEALPPMALFSRSLSTNECAVVVQRGKEPLLLRGPGSVRTFQRWDRVIVVDLRPFIVALVPYERLSHDGVAYQVGGSVVSSVRLVLARNE
jgi:hypothetical protein